MEQDKKALLFNGILLLTTLFVLLSGPIIATMVPTLLVEIFSVLLIVWALIARKVNKNKHPHLPAGYFFVAYGPYEIIRHPIYAGFFLIILSLVESEFTFLRLLALLVIVFMLLLKIIREESTMLHEVKEYHEYKKKTKAIIPLFL